MSTTVGEILKEAQIIPAMQAADRWQAIDELLNKLVATGDIKAENLATVSGAVRKREQCMSTGIGSGIGIPHASTDGISVPLAAFGRSEKGIAFEALDGQSVKLVVLLLVPQGQIQKHLHTVSNLARQLRQPEFRDALSTATDAAAILKIFQQPLPGSPVA
jgi:mannitol/fructose-specific phosphotransferase system IIA component (Ntr-type)